MSGIDGQHAYCVVATFKNNGKKDGSETMRYETRSKILAIEALNATMEMPGFVNVTLGVARVSGGKHAENDDCDDDDDENIVIEKQDDDDDDKKTKKKTKGKRKAHVFAEPEPPRRRPVKAAAVEEEEEEDKEEEVVEKKRVPPPRRVANTESAVRREQEKEKSTQQERQTYRRNQLIELESARKALEDNAQKPEAMHLALTLYDIIQHERTWKEISFKQIDPLEEELDNVCAQFQFEKEEVTKAYMKQPLSEDARRAVQKVLASSAPQPNYRRTRKSNPVEDVD